MNTPYHALDLKIQTIIDSFDESSSQVENSNRERIKTLKWNVEMDSEDEKEPSEVQLHSFRIYSHSRTNRSTIHMNLWMTTATLHGQGIYSNYIKASHN